MLKIAIIGSSGLVGQELISLLEKFENSISLTPIASKKSFGKSVEFKGEKLLTQTMPMNFNQFDLVFFCASSSLAKAFIPNILKDCCKVIDLSSAYRDDENIPLVIPEINSEVITSENQLISSPNCTTTMLLLALYPLHEKFCLKTVITSTYQAASGGGNELLNTLKNETKQSLEDPTAKAFFAFNVYPHPQKSSDPDWNLEEKKMINESRKILQNASVQIYPTCIRVPTLRTHSLSIHATFSEEVYNPRQWLKKAPYLTVVDDLSAKDAEKQNSIFVSRIRQINNRTVEMWVSGDQLLKGASLNAYQTLELLTSKGYLEAGTTSPC